MANWPDRQKHRPQPPASRLSAPAPPSACPRRPTPGWTPEGWRQCSALLGAARQSPRSLAQTLERLPPHAALGGTPALGHRPPTQHQRDAAKAENRAPPCIQELLEIKNLLAAFAQLNSPDGWRRRLAASLRHRKIPGSPAAASVPASSLRRPNASWTASVSFRGRTKVIFNYIGRSQHEWFHKHALLSGRPIGTGSGAVALKPAAPLEGGPPAPFKNRFFPF